MPGRWDATWLGVEGRCGREATLLDGLGRDYDTAGREREYELMEGLREAAPPR